MGNNIQVPYTGHVSGGIKDGMKVVIIGRLGHENKSFAVNLCSGGTVTNGDVAFQFNPRIIQGQVVRNHKQGGSWGLEETDGGFPFKEGRPFELKIKVKSGKYEVEVDDNDFCEFSHRLPKETVHYLNITGDVQISRIQFKFPLPYSAYIPGGLRHGSVITVHGKPKDDFERFSINFCSAPTKEQGDTALHFSARRDQGCVVRNHKQGGWGAEETAGGLPFYREQMFQLQFAVFDHGYKVSVNGNHFCDFTHRMPKEAAQYLYIEGDLEINSVLF